MLCARCARNHGPYTVKSSSERVSCGR